MVPMGLCKTEKLFIKCKLSYIPCVLFTIFVYLKKNLRKKRPKIFSVFPPSESMTMVVLSQAILYKSLTKKEFPMLLKGYKMLAHICIILLIMQIPGSTCRHVIEYVSFASLPSAPLPALLYVSGTHAALVTPAL